MSIRLLWVLSVVFAVALGESYTHTQNISQSMPFTGNFGPWNLRNNATFNVTHSVPIVVCIVPTEFGLPSEVQYAEDVCSFYQYFKDEGSHVFAESLTFTNFTFGIYFAKDVKPVNSSITVSIEGESCADGEFSFTGTDCIKAIPFQVVNDTGTMTHEYQPGEVVFYTQVVPPRVSQLKATLRIPDDLEAEHFTFYARYNGPAQKDVYDYMDLNNGTITVDLPHSGTWVFAVSHVDHHGAASASFTLSYTPCEAGHAGVDCRAIPEAANKADLLITSTGEKSVFYYYFQATAKQGLLVSVTAQNATYNPFIYATRDQLPDTEGKNADIRNCNGGYCNIVRSIAHNITDAKSVDATEDWFIAVVSSLKSGNTTIGIWFNTTCVTGCQTDNRGTCNEDGTCDCQIDYMGIDCSTSRGLGPHYIVLIIIASLVVASAVIGFVAWAYMRRKRHNYEILT